MDKKTQREIKLSLQGADVTKDSGKTKASKNKQHSRCVFCRNFGYTCKKQKWRKKANNLQRNQLVKIKVIRRETLLNAMAIKQIELAVANSHFPRLSKEVFVIFH